MSVVSPDIRQSVPAEPRAHRIQAPGWRNPRLLVGLILVFASIAFGARLMAVADTTIPMFAASRALPTGTALARSDLLVVRLRLTGTHAAYLDARKPVPIGVVLTRPIGAGELIPGSALVSASQLRLRPVSIPLEGPRPGDLRTGGLVDIWASAKAADSAEGAYLDAQRIASAVEVSGVQVESRSLSAGSAATVQVLLQAEALPAVLNALANRAQIAVLPIPGAQITSPPEGGAGG
jgi:hypothetical protein